MPYITRDNIDALLDAGRLEIALVVGRWHPMSRRTVELAEPHPLGLFKVPFALHWPFIPPTSGYLSNDSFRFGPNGDALNPQHFRIVGEG